MLGFKRLPFAQLQTINQFLFPVTRQLCTTANALDEYNRRIKELSEAEKFDLVFEQYESMLENGVQPDNKTMGELIFVGGKMKKLGLVKKYLRESREKLGEDNLDLLIYSKAMLGFIRCSKPKKAIELFSELKEKKKENKPGNIQYCSECAQ